VDVRFVTDRGPRTVIGSIDFVGNRDIPDEELLPFVQTEHGPDNRPGGTYRPDILRHGLWQVIAYLYDHGKVDAVVHPPRVDLCTPLPSPGEHPPLRPGEEALCITIAVDEGPTYRYGRVDISGLPEALRRELAAQLRIRTGNVFSRSELQEDVASIGRRCKSLGLAGVLITPLVEHLDTRSRTVDLVYRVDLPGTEEENPSLR
jgi:outer membrane protein insertion porin family